MIQTINYSRPGDFTGRNGYFKSTGIETMIISDDMVMITPITSKGKPGRCDISIPIEDVPALIEQLQDIIKNSAQKGMYRIKLTAPDPQGAAGHIKDGYLAVNGVIQWYELPYARRKAQLFNGKMERVSQ